jgi:hypothetical protein
MRPPKVGPHVALPGWAHVPTRHHPLKMSSTIATGAAGARGPREWWRRLPSRQRRILWALFAVAVIVVLLVGALLARWLSAENAERSDDLALVQAEAKGNLAGMLAQLSGCRASPSCLTSAKANARDPRVHRAGAVKILQLESPTANSLSGATGKTRLAWTVIGTLPVVQCVDVRRTGSFLSGIHVQLIGISPPISGEGTCSKRTQLEQQEEEAARLEQGAS